MRKTALLVILLILSSAAMIPLAVNDDNAETEWHPAYDSLTAEERKNYDDLLDTIRSYKTVSKISGIDIDSAEKVHQALRSDYPELFWADSYVLYVSLTSPVEYRCDSLDVQALKEKRAEFVRALSEVSLNEGQYIDIACSAHDWIISHSTYDLNAPDCHNAYGVFVGHRAVCDGYSCAFNMLCKLRGIQSVVFTGSVSGYDDLHAWNAVSLEDGAWYYVDVTWDDPVYRGIPAGGISHDYFVIGSKTNTPTGTFESTRSVMHTFGIEVSETGRTYDYSLGIFPMAVAAFVVLLAAILVARLLSKRRYRHAAVNVMRCNGGSVGRTWKCPACGALNPEDSGFCMTCGENRRV